MQLECLSTENDHFDEGHSGSCVHKKRVIAQVINMIFRNGARFFAVSHYATENVILCSTMNVIQLVVNSSEPYFRMLKRLFTEEPMLIVIGRSDIFRL